MLRSSSLLPSGLLLSTFLPRFPSAPFALTQVSTALLFRVQPTIGTLTPASVHLADRSPRLLRATIPSFRPQPRGTPPHRFIRHDSVLCYFQASPLSCRLAAIPRRNRFVNLRTDSSLPVTPHPASRRRSYLQLRSCGQLRQGLSPCKWHAITGVHETAGAVVGLRLSSGGR